MEGKKIFMRFNGQARARRTGEKCGVGVNSGLATPVWRDCDADSDSKNFDIFLNFRRHDISTGDEIRIDGQLVSPMFLGIV